MIQIRRRDRGHSLTSWLLAALAAGVLPASPAGALERTRTPTSDIPVLWDRTPVPLLVDARPQLPPLAPAAVLADLRASAARWGRGSNTCTSISLLIRADSSAGPAPEAIIDNVNRLVIRRDTWCNPARPEAPCHNPAALAITTVTARRSDGVLLDVDIELNAVGPRWADLVAGGDPGGGAHDLQAALTHEFGHFLGFDHSCQLPGEPAAPGIPGCTEADASALDSVMYPVEVPGASPRREPTALDLQSVCAIYPALPDTILGDGSVGCSAAGAGNGRGSASGARWVLLLVALGAVVWLSRLPARLAGVGKLLRRRRVSSTASAARSFPANRQPCFSAARPAGPEPMNGSTTSSPGAAL